MIYIREAHPSDGWDIGESIRDPTTIEERRAVAGRCESAMSYGIRTYVDEMDDAVMVDYVAWPERLYLVDGSGLISYAGGRGPDGFNPTDLKNAIDQVVG